jgi:hypothetical protein
MKRKVVGDTADDSADENKRQSCAMQKGCDENCQSMDDFND